MVRAMCILSHPIPSTNDSHSVQIILPQKQLNRRHGACLSPPPVLAVALWRLRRTRRRTSPISTGLPLQLAGAACTLVPHLEGALRLQPLLQPSCPATDIYVFCCSYTHNVAPRDKWIAFVSTTVETSDPQSELAPGGGTLL